MPRRTDLKSVLVIGSGPIVIGQACEFDYSGTQACRVLRAEGIRVVLVNSNPATIMTDPDFADATYIEPITPEFVEQIIARERPDALLATLGGLYTPTGAFLAAMSYALFPELQKLVPELGQVQFLLTGLGVLALGRNRYGVGGQIADAGERLRAVRLQRLGVARAAG